jgi:TetR/AcrR family transcriptional regulator, regulator of biofilm formation and stress response
MAERASPAATPDGAASGSAASGSAASGSATARALLDATERLLVAGGAVGLSTRRIAEEAGQSHGLIRYHFGSLEGLMIRTLERATGRILTRQRALYAGDQPFLDKWRTAMAYLEADLRTDPFPKLAGEVLALGWNTPAYRPALRQMMEGFTGMLGDAVRSALAEHRLPDEDVAALATLIRTFQLGMMAERLAGIDIGHADLLRAIETWLRRLPPAGPAGSEGQSAGREGVSWSTAGEPTGSGKS